MWPVSGISAGLAGHGVSSPSFQPLGLRLGAAEHDYSCYQPPWSNGQLDTTDDYSEQNKKAGRARESQMI